MPDPCLCLETLRGPFLLPKDSALSTCFHQLDSLCQLQPQQNRMQSWGSRRFSSWVLRTGYNYLHQAVVTTQKNAFNMESTSPEVPALSPVLYVIWPQLHVAWEVSCREVVTIPVVLRLSYT